MSKNILQLVDTPYPSLKHSPLVLAVFEIQFKSLFDVTEQKVAAFQRAVQAKYPVAIGYPPPPTDPDAEIKRERKEIARWTFTDRDDNWRITLSKEVLSIEIRAYNSFAEALERLEEAFGWLIELIQPTVITEIGLRHINEIRGSTLKAGTRWSQIIRRDLLGPFAIPEFMANATGISSLHKLVFAYADDVRIIIQHGLFVKGTMLGEPKKGLVTDDPFYLLKFDVYHEFPLPGTMVEISTGTLQPFFKEYHEIACQLFYWSITPEYIALQKEDI